MRRPAAPAAIAALFTAPVAARAAEAAGGGGPGMFGVFLQMVASLALVLGVIWLFYYLSSRWLKVGVHQRGGAERHIRLVETRYLAPKKSLVLVEVGGEYLLLGSSGDRLAFIKQIDILEEIEVVDEEEKRLPLATLFQGKLDAVAARIAALKQGRADSPTPQARQS